MALFEVAQAVTMHMFGPRNPNSIEINPLAMLLISIGMVKAETRLGPFVEQNGVLVFERFQSADAAADENAEAIAVHFVQVDPGIGASPFSPPPWQDGRNDRSAARPLGLLKNCFRIEVAHFSADPAIVSRWYRSDSILPMPLTPFFRFFQNVSRSLPNGVTDTHSGDNDSAIVIHENVISD